jgi:tetratricopeptide (TPR) repeat protein
VIHRDVKPANLMVEGDRLYVMDFGLAKSTRVDASLSASGAILGTPAYMSPEQARGGEVDPRTDVDSLGATLYELLKKVVEADPRPPRRGGLDLRTIVMKCLEKDRERRYATAAELAEDLDRWLKGEAIRARAPSTFYRLRKFLSRRRAASAAAIAGVAAVAVAAVFVPRWLQARAKAREEERKAKEAASESARSRDQAIELMRRVSAGAVDAILKVRRKGGRAFEVFEALEPTLRDTYRQASAAVPDLAEPDYLMGRVHRTVALDEAAEEFQARALAKDPGYAPALYEMLVLVSRRYAHEHVQTLVHLREEGGDPNQIPPIEELRRRNPSMAARGMAAFRLNRTDEALPLLEEALRLDPFLDEVYEALAAWDMTRAEADRFYSCGLEVDPGCFDLLIGRGRLRQAHAALQVAGGSDLAPLLQSAEADADRAIDLYPKLALGWMLRGGIRATRGTFRARDGLDPCRTGRGRSRT